MFPINPFQNDDESLTIDDLTIKNGLDRISVYGSLDVTKDKAGLQQARTLKAAIDAMVAKLEREKALPDRVPVKFAGNGKNTFG